MGSHTRRVLFNSPAISLVDFRCTAHGERDEPEEATLTHSIVLVRRGVFCRTERGHTLVADPNHILFFNRARVYRYSHPIPGGDDCTILAISTPLALELVARYAPRDAEKPETPFYLSHGLSSPRTTQLHYQLLTLVRRTAPTLALEDTLTELADEAVRAAYVTHGRGRHGIDEAVPSAVRRARDLVEAVKLTLNQQPKSPPSLSDLARRFGCSPFHLSPSFHRTTGLSLRRYFGRLRASIAAHRLAGGAPDLTDLALDLGYTDHSHFTNAFRHEWGLPPSQFRARHRPG
jgi:AraC family transcriptional regulator